MNHANKAICINRLILADVNPQIPTLTLGNILYATLFGISKLYKLASSLCCLPTGNRRSFPPEPLPHVANVNGSIQLHSFIAKARIDNADNKPRPCARVLAIYRFCFIYSLSCSSLFFLGCLTS